MTNIMLSFYLSPLAISLSMYICRYIIRTISTGISLIECLLIPMQRRGGGELIDNSKFSTSETHENHAQVSRQVGEFSASFLLLFVMIYLRRLIIRQLATTSRRAIFSLSLSLSLSLDISPRVRWGRVS